MGIRMPEMVLHAKQIIQRRSSSKRQQFRSYQTSKMLDVPKGHFAIYVGQEEKKKRFVVPVSYLKHPSFQTLLSEAEEEFGFDHKMQRLTIPCAEDVFINLTSRLN